MPDDIPRRTFIGASVAGLGAVWLGAARGDLLAAAAHAVRAAQAPPPNFQFLTRAQAAEVESFTSRIIPSDDSPGAKEAHVVHFIDRGLSTFAKDQQPLFNAGLKDLQDRVIRRFPNATSFASLNAKQQETIVGEIEKENPHFFDAMRGATVAGMFSSPEYGGNFNKVGWKLIGFDDRFSWQPPFGYYDGDHASNE
jgi:gluconate 2-dehydrogenase gamma chain